MSGSTILLTIIAGVCLLLYGLSLVQNGVTRAYGAQLKNFIAKNTKSRIRSFLSGLSVTTVVQSSTATSLIVSAFADKNMVTLSAALAVLLGADVGTTLIAQLLSLDLSFLMPLMIIVGAIGNRMFKTSTPTFICRAILGLGIMLMALRMILGASVPMSQSDVTREIFTSLDDEVFLAFLFSALLTWLSHSSLATILFVMTLASQGLLSLPVSLVFVIGAQVGGSIAPLILNIKSPHGGRYVTIGEFSMRLLGALLILPFIPAIATYFPHFLGELPARQVVNFHTLSSLGRAIVFLPFTPYFARTIKKLFYKPAIRDEDISEPRYLDEGALDTPAIALSCAARETLRLGDIVETMLKQSINAFDKDDLNVVQTIHDTEENVDKLYTHIKLYMTRISSKGLTKQEGQRAVEILTFATNLEHIGDILDRNICDLADKKIRRNVAFSTAGLKEIIDFHAQVCSNMKLAFNTFMTPTVRIAKKLIKNKTELRTLAEKTQEKHFKRLRDGKPETVQTSSIHIDLIRDLARINGHLTSVAFNILEENKNAAESHG